MKKSNNKIHSLLLSSILILQLMFLYFIKYSNQNLSLEEFSLNNIGNIFNLFITISIVSGIIIYSRKKEEPDRLTKILILLSSLVLIITYLFSILKVPTVQYYILGQPGNKIVNAFLFTIYQYILFTLISIIWLKIIGSDRLILLRSLLNGIFLLVVFLILTTVFIQTKVSISENWQISKDERNVIVVLGAAVWSDNRPSPSLSGRVDRAVELFYENAAGEIIFTGGNAPGELSEAQVAMEYARKNGMQMSKVRFETVTSSTTEQISYMRKNLIGQNNIQDIIVVSDAYHLVRVLEISNFFNIDIKVAASRMKLEEDGKIYRQLRESIALIVFWSFAL